MPSPLEVRRIQDVEGLRSLEIEWEAVVRASASATIFSAPDWLVSWWNAFSAGRRLVVLAFYDSSKLIGLAPLQLSGFSVAPGLSLRSLELMGDGSHDSDHLDIPVLPGHEDAVTASFLQELKNLKNEWDICRWDTLPADSAIGTRMLALLQKEGWAHHKGTHPGAVIPLPETWKAYLETISKKERDKLRYYMNRLERRYKVEITPCRHGSELPTRLDALFELHGRRWIERGEEGTFATAERRQFYRELAGRLIEKKLLEFWQMSLDGEPVAAQFGFRFRDTVYSLQEGFDPRFHADRVGYLLRGEVLQHLVEQGVRGYDFLGGEGSGKERWATTRTEYLDISFAARHSKGSAYLSAQRMAIGIEEGLRSRLPPKAFGTLRSLYRRIRPVE